MKTIKEKIMKMKLLTCLSLLPQLFYAQTSDLSASFNVTNIDCFGNNNATISMSVTGGTQPYSYFWSNGQTTEDLTGLMAGNYSVMVTDATGYSEIFSTEVNGPEAPLSLTSNILNASDFGAEDGVISVNVTGGTAFKFQNPYIYQWSNGENSQNIVDLAAGLYTLTVFDANGCSVSSNFTVSQPFPSVMNSTVNPNQNALAISTSIFPNPSLNNHTTVKWDNHITSISIFSLGGEKLMDAEVGGENSLELTNIPSGEYLVYSFENSSLVSTKRFSVK